MKDNPKKDKEVSMNSELVPQHKRMAAGTKITGKAAPSAKAAKKSA